MILHSEQKNEDGIIVTGASVFPISPPPRTTAELQFLSDAGGIDTGTVASYMWKNGWKRRFEMWNFQSDWPGFLSAVGSAKGYLEAYVGSVAEPITTPHGWTAFEEYVLRAYRIRYFGARLTE